MDQQSLERAIKVNCTTTLFFARLGQLSKDELKEYCEMYGPVKDVSIMFDPTTKKHKGCGFVKFVTHEDAKRCVEEAPQRNKNDPAKKNWVIEWAKSSQIKEGDLDKRTVYISNLTPANNSEDLLRRRFEEFGPIEKITNIENMKGSFAFIKFERMESAVEAINRVNGTEWMGSRIVLEFSETMESKRTRRQKATLKKQFMTSHKPVYSQQMDHISLNEQPVCHRATRSYTQALSQIDVSTIPAIVYRHHSQTVSPIEIDTAAQTEPNHTNTYISSLSFSSSEDEDTDLPVFREIIGSSSKRSSRGEYL